jgi:hypothetical protein
MLDAVGLVDALSDVDAPTWPTCQDTFSRAWTARIGRAPKFSLEPRRLDYLLARGLRVTDRGVHPLRHDDGMFASDHALVTAEFSTSG